MLREQMYKPQSNFLCLIGFPGCVFIAVNEIIDRDIGKLSGAAQPDQFDQYHQYDWELKPGDAAALPFCGGPQ